MQRFRFDPSFVKELFSLSTIRAIEHRSMIDPHFPTTTRRVPNLFPLCAHDEGEIPRGIAQMVDTATLQRVPDAFALTVLTLEGPTPRGGGREIGFTERDDRDVHTVVQFLPDGPELVREETRRVRTLRFGVDFDLHFDDAVEELLHAERLYVPEANDDENGEQESTHERQSAEAPSVL